MASIFQNQRVRVAGIGGPLPESSTSRGALRGVVTPLTVEIPGAWRLSDGEGNRRVEAVGGAI